MSDYLLEINDISASYGDEDIVKSVSFSMLPGEIVCIVGESGSGKSTLIRGILGLLSSGGKVTEGSVIFNGSPLTDKALKKLRGQDIAMIFQDAGLAMDPIQKVGKQFVEYTLTHQELSREQAEELAVSWLQRLQLTDARRVMDSYPFELSGGMKQRVAIAMAMAQSPKLLLADEPTSALDVTIQAQVVLELEKLARNYGTAVIMVTHNMAVASYLADHIAVMKDGEIVEYGTREEVILSPSGAYTRMLLNAVPKLQKASAASIAPSPSLLTLNHVRKTFQTKGRMPVCAVSSASFALCEGECLGIVGESGCGKTTLARMIIGTYPPTDGEIILKGKAFSSISRREKADFRRHVQMVFQNPISSFSPRMTVGDYLYEPLRNYEKMSRRQAQPVIHEYLSAVGLSAEYTSRLPHELSGGQLQRVAVARAALIRPQLIVCDEATSALDVSIQAQVVEMLISLQKQWGLSYLFIGHDLALIQKVSQRIVVMYMGEIVEVLDSAGLVENAVHPYTKVLLDAVFDLYEEPEIRRKKLQSMKIARPVPSQGCKFAPRCPLCSDICHKNAPELKAYAAGHLVSCNAI